MGSVAAVTHPPAYNRKQSSQTALMAAAARAAHLIVDGEPTIFADPLAETMLGDQAETLIAYHRWHGSHAVLAGARAQATLRARLAESRVAAGLAAGTDQYVILGAGLDSFAYRQPAGARGGMRVFEVDHPASQDWKRGRLRDAGIDIPSLVTYVAVNFENESLRDALIRGRLRRQPAGDRELARRDGLPDPHRHRRDARRHRIVRRRNRAGLRLHAHRGTPG